MTLTACYISKKASNLFSNSIIGFLLMSLVSFDIVAYSLLVLLLGNSCSVVLILVGKSPNSIVSVFMGNFVFKTFVFPLEQFSKNYLSFRRTITYGKRHHLFLYISNTFPYNYHPFSQRILV